MADILLGYTTCPHTREAFRALGHLVYTCDTRACPVGDPMHIQDDIANVLYLRWAYALLHPMCTYLTGSTAWAYNDPNYEKYPGIARAIGAQRGALFK